MRRQGVISMPCRFAPGIDARPLTALGRNGPLPQTIELQAFSPYDRCMASMTLPIRTIALFALAAAAPLCAQDSQKTSIDGRCQYPEKVVKNRNETVLILCDTVEIDRGSARATLDFAQRSWGSMARFTGSMSSDTMTISPSQTPWPPRAINRSQAACAFCWLGAFAIRAPSATERIHACRG